MKLNCFSIIFFLGIIPFLPAQSLDWYENMGTRTRYFEENHLIITQIESDSQFVYVLGGFEVYPIQFQRSGLNIPFESWYKDGFLAQYTHDGVLQWVKTLGSENPYSRYRRHFMKLHKGAIYLTGTFFEQFWFGSDSVQSTRTNVYLAKYNSNGNKIWHKLASPTFWFGDNEPKGIWIDAQDQIYLAGEQRGFRPLIFDSLSTGEGNRFFFFKLDPKGNPLQAGSFSKSFHFADAQIDKYNDFWLLMSDAAQSTYSSCDELAWTASVYRLNAQGQMDSMLAMSCSGLMKATSLTFAENGDMYIAGQYRGQLHIGAFKSEDKGCISTAFVTRVTPKGRVVWFKTGNIGDYSDIYQMRLEKEGNLLTMGIQQYELEQSKERFRHANYLYPYPNGESRICINRISPYGATIDSIQFYTHPHDMYRHRWRLMRFTQSPQGAIFFGAEYQYRLDTFSHSLYSGWSPRDLNSPDTLQEADGTKLLIARLGKQMLQKKHILPPLAENQFHLFPNPSSDFIFIQSQLPLQEPVTITIHNMNGQLVQEVTHYDKNDFISLDIGNQPTGMYVLTIRKNGQLLFLTKMIKL